MSRLGLTELDANLDELEALLVEYGVKVALGSALEEIRLHLKEYVEMHTQRLLCPNGTEDRILEGDQYFWLSWQHQCKIPELHFERAHAEDELRGNTHELSLDALLWVFERFNWPESPKDVICETQSNILARSIL